MSNILPTATLGRTGLQVTRLGFGSGHRRSMTDQEMDAQLNAVLDAGINFIDTANDYGNSEEMIGRFLRHRRDEFVLATKCGCNPDGHIWTRENLFRGLHESLERLRVDYVDVMQLHNPTVADCEQGELVDALQDMRTQGKVRWIGMSTILPHLPTYLDWDVFDVYQIPLFRAGTRTRKLADHDRASRRGHYHPRRSGTRQAGRRSGHIGSLASVCGGRAGRLAASGRKRHIIHPALYVVAP